MSKKNHSYCSICHKKREQRSVYCLACGSRLFASKKAWKIHLEDQVEKAYAIKPEPVLSSRQSNVPELIVEKDKKTLEFKDVWDEVLHFMTHLDKNVFSSLKKLIVSPGKTLNDFVKLGKYKNAVAYFCISISIYSLLTHLLFPNIGITKYLLSTRFPTHVEIPILLTVLIGIAVSGYFALGWRGLNGKKKNDEDDYHFGEVFMICLNIYGTNYFLAPIVVVICNIFSKPLERLFYPSGDVNEETMSFITDLPLALFMIYTVLRLIMVKRNNDGFNYLWQRFLLFTVLAGSYYYFMLPLVLKLVNFIHPETKHE